MLEAYRHLVEQRLLQFDPHHVLPVSQEHLLQSPGKTDGGHITSIETINSSADLKRQLAIKEQDLLYAK